MENKTITIEREKVKDLYNTLTNYPAISKDQVIYEMNKCFGSKTFEPQNITERIKTFDDCIDALGKDHALVKQYLGISSLGLDEPNNDIIAYLELRIMVAALNEGWEPEFVEDERRWYPWFYNITNERYNEMDDDERAEVCGVVGRAYFNASANGGLVYAYAYFASSSSYAYNGSRLALRTEELAEYAGKQFIELYRNFIFA